jgi:hypothetical protein
MSGAKRKRRSVNRRTKRKPRKVRRRRLFNKPGRGTKQPARRKPRVGKTMPRYLRWDHRGFKWSRAQPDEETLSPGGMVLRTVRGKKLRYRLYQDDQARLWARLDEEPEEESDG